MGWWLTPKYLLRILLTQSCILYHQSYSRSSKSSSPPNKLSSVTAGSSVSSFFFGLTAVRVIEVPVAVIMLIGTFGSSSISSRVISSSAISSSTNMSGFAVNISRPLINTTPDLRSAFRFFRLVFSSASFSAAFFAFQAKKRSSVIGVCVCSFFLSSSISWTIEIVETSSFFLSFLRMYPGGSACLYLHPKPFGQSQNQPYFLFSTASRKYLQTMSVLFEL
mmetsp:Transcript_10545/g.13037  ORF Transcript_10545/g.13037 Transcript_10545/m.13037 type:complete len:221 (+) Transcript_10545:36-698(+)